MLKLLNKKPNLYLKLLNLLTKNGKRGKVKCILNFAFLKACIYFNQPFSYLLNKLFFLLNTFVETKTVRVRRRKYVVPFPMTLNRRIFTVAKWILSLRKTKQRETFSSKIAKEIILILESEGSAEHSRLLSLRSIYTSKALANRSNLHYRW
jgi:ribosomal protein S7